MHCEIFEINSSIGQAFQNKTMNKINGIYEGIKVKNDQKLEKLTVNLIEHLLFYGWISIR